MPKAILDILPEIIFSSDIINEKWDHVNDKNQIKAKYYFLIEFLWDVFFFFIYDLNLWWVKTN